MNFKVKTKFLSSKISKRIFTTFVVCALLPVGCLAIIAYFQVANNLQRQTFRDLHHSAKHQSKIIFDRLYYLEKELKIIGELTDYNLEDDIDLLSDRLRSRLLKFFNGISFLPNLAQPPKLLNTSLIQPFVFGQDDFAHLAAGNSLLFENNTSQLGPQIYMMSPVDNKNADRGYWIGEIKLDRLWQLPELSNLPYDTEYCILSASNKLLFSSKPHIEEILGVDKTKIKSATSGHFETDFNQGTYLVSYTQLFLEPSFKMSHWNIILVKSKSDVFAPIANFKKIFLLIVSLTFMVVLYLSLVNIRKSLVPINALKSGVKKIANKNFDCKLDIKSGDELEELAVAFNNMSEQLKVKFSELKLIAELGNEITNILEVDELVGSIIRSIREYLSFNRGLILLFDGNSKTQNVIYDKSFGFEGDEAEELRNLTLNMNANHNQNPILKSYASQEPVIINNYSSAYTDDLPQILNTNALACIPIIYENKTLGILLLAKKSPDELIRAEDTEVLSGIMAQTAVSLKNIGVST